MDLTTAASVLPFGVSFMLCGSGIYGVISPLNCIRLFGLPQSTESHSHIYPAVGGRNLSAGVATFILGLTGHRRAAGILLTSWSLTGMADTMVCVRYGEKVSVHAINTLICGTIGAFAWVEGSVDKRIDQLLATAIGLEICVMLINSWWPRTKQRID